MKLKINISYNIYKKYYIKILITKQELNKYIFTYEQNKLYIQIILLKKHYHLHYHYYSFSPLLDL